MDIGKKLKEKRQEANLTQKELAEILHVSRQTISSWEVGRTYPDLDILIALSDFYETPLDDLLKEDSEMVEDITKKVKKSQRRKILNIVLGVALVIVISIGLFSVWNTRQNNQENAYGLKPNDLLDSTWEMVFTPTENLENSNLSFNSDSLMIWNDYLGQLNPYISSEELEDNSEEELSEKGLENGVVTYEDLSVEVEEESYIVLAYGYRQRFERLSDSVIRDMNGTEYSKVTSSSSHDAFKVIRDKLNGE